MGLYPVAAARQELLLRKGKVVLIATQVAIHDVHSFDGVVAGSHFIDVSYYCEE